MLQWEDCGINFIQAESRSKGGGGIGVIVGLRVKKANSDGIKYLICALERYIVLDNWNRRVDMQ